MATLQRLGVLSCLWQVLATGLLPCPGNTTANDMLAGQNLSGKVAIVTGGDSGLGLAMVRALAYKGAKVVIGSRNQSKAEHVAREVKAATGADVSATRLDLSSMASVRSFASGFDDIHGPRLHLLINNAGVGSPSKMTADGYELVFEIDYLGHFLLTELLLPALRAGSPSRVVNVASGAHENACESAGWPEGCFKDWTYLPPPVVPKKEVTVHYRSGAAVVNSSSYGVAKFLNIQHAAALALRERHTGVTAFSLTPGFALTSMTAGFDPRSPKAKAFCEQQVHPDPSIPINPCPFTAEQGAAVIAFCATSPDLLASHANGAYFSRTFACQSRPIAMHGFTEAMQLELYDRSLQWTKLGRAWGPRAEEYI